MARSAAALVRLALLALALGAHGALAAPPGDIQVAVKIKQGEVTIDLSCFVKASPEEVWAVITDYDHATHFISDLEESKVLSRSERLLVVSQKGKMGVGPFSTTMESTARIELSPFTKLESHTLGGTMRHHHGVTRLVPQEGGTLLVYHADSHPDVWIPPVLGPSLVAHEARERFSQLRAEVLRRINQPNSATP